MVYTATDSVNSTVGCMHNGGGAGGGGEICRTSLSEVFFCELENNF